VNEPSPEWTDGAADLCAWAQKEGFPAFVIVGIGDLARYIGPQYPAPVIAKFLRMLADQYEIQAPSDRTLN
jgi:hypothetical protein